MILTGAVGVFHRTVLYECCPGYMKLDGMHGCPAVAPIDHVYGTLGVVKATSTQRYSDISKLRAEIEGPGSYTFFAPSNEAWDALDQTTTNALVNNVNVELYNALHFHMSNRRLLTKDLKNGMTVTSMYNDLGLYINHYPNGVVTVNCARIIQGNQVATNGAVHVIDRVISAVGTTIQDFIEVDEDLSTFNEVAQTGSTRTLHSQVMELVGDSQSTFRDMVAQLGLSTAMKPKADYTLLAPLNVAFSDDIMSKDQKLLRIILENHIMKNKVVLGQLYNGQHLETIGGKRLRVFIYRTAVCIENSCLIRGSKEGSNGALHITKTLLRPAEKSMYEILMENGRFKIFLSLMEAADLTNLLKQEGDFTLFAPSDKAFAGLTESDLTLLKSDKNALRTILLYHFNKGIFIGGGLENGVTNIIKSLQGNNIKVIFANRTMQVNSLQIPESDIMSTNGVIHFVNHIMYPGDIPVGNQNLLKLLKKLITNIQIKYTSGYRYQEIPLTFLKRVVQEGANITTLTRVIQSKPSFTKMTIEGIDDFQPSITKIAKVVQGPQYSSSAGISTINLEDRSSRRTTTRTSW
uniref:Periostin n=1 Tax=Tetraodon nigroviridis TaxID=99883 RepID=H3DFR9_TETNG